MDAGFSKYHECIGDTRAALNITKFRLWNLTRGYPQIVYKYKAKPKDESAADGLPPSPVLFKEYLTHRLK